MTVRFEHTLPHLPVPTLEETADRYLASIKPYHTAQEPQASAEPLKSWTESEAAVREFVQSPLVHKLQERLQQRAEGKESWLSEWWNETAYFGYRGPVVPGTPTTPRRSPRGMLCVLRRPADSVPLFSYRCQLFLQPQG